MRPLAAAIAGLALLGAAPAPPPVALDALLAEAPAPKLSEYRLFADLAAMRPNAGLTPYTLKTPLFSDYAEKARLLYLPPGRRATYRPEGVFDFPVGAALVKTFAYPADLRRPGEDVRRLETRLLIRKASGWVAYAYVWNADQTEAVLKRAGARLDVNFVDIKGRPQHVDYAVPNQNQCKECHQLDKALTPIGPRAWNLNGDFPYPTGRENQLAHWRRAGLLDGFTGAAPQAPAWDDPKGALDGRARAYLDVNCAHCHNPRGIASNSGLFLSFEASDRTALGVGKRPVAAGRGSGGLEVAVEPGHPEASILAYRMASTEPGVMMPELGRSLTHAEGLALIEAWIKDLN